MQAMERTGWHSYCTSQLKPGWVWCCKSACSDREYPAPPTINDRQVFPSNVSRLIKENWPPEADTSNSSDASALLPPTIHVGNPFPACDYPKYLRELPIDSTVTLQSRGCRYLCLQAGRASAVTYWRRSPRWSDAMNIDFSSMCHLSSLAKSASSHVLFIDLNNRCPLRKDRELHQRDTFHGRQIHLLIYYLFQERSPQDAERCLHYNFSMN
ncbi:hypothetical protein FPV67DRAFT_1087601 [Lyophyllum atratum]|nr:hypothetical protein FPV67DRAFT_1087601 [Lyophyllum atratum]